jgi:hypothetical protein
MVVYVLPGRQKLLEPRLFTEDQEFQRILNIIACKRLRVLAILSRIYKFVFFSQRLKRVLSFLSDIFVLACSRRKYDVREDVIALRFKNLADM